MNHHLTAPAATLVGVLPFVLTVAGAAPARPPTSSAGAHLQLPGSTAGV
ncbi:hypothetical protein [Streptomyces sp. NPDC056105]